MYTVTWTQTSQYNRLMSRVVISQPVTWLIHFYLHLVLGAFGGDQDPTENCFTLEWNKNWLWMCRHWHRCDEDRFPIFNVVLNFIQIFFMFQCFKCHFHAVVSIIAGVSIILHVVSNPGPTETVNGQLYKTTCNINTRCNKRTAQLQFPYQHALVCVDSCQNFWL